jgi:hypothetical protein
MSVFFLVMKIYTRKLQEELLILKGISPNTDTNDSLFKIKSVNPISLFFLVYYPPLWN